jgi:hypothetical protein
MVIHHLYIQFFRVDQIPLIELVEARMRLRYSLRVFALSEAAEAARCSW